MPSRGAVQGASAPGSPAEVQQWPMGAAGFTAGRAPALRRPMASSGRGRLLYGTGSTRTRRKRNGVVPVLLSSHYGRLWRAFDNEFYEQGNASHRPLRTVAD